MKKSAAPPGESQPACLVAICSKVLVCSLNGVSLSSFLVALLISPSPVSSKLSTEYNLSNKEKMTAKLKMIEDRRGAGSRSRQETTVQLRKPDKGDQVHKLQITGEDGLTVFISTTEELKGYSKVSISQSTDARIAEHMQVTTRFSTSRIKDVADCENAVPALVKLLNSPDANVREHAIKCIGKIVGKSVSFRDVCLREPEVIEGM
jgi:hypothetical protein